MSNQDKSLFAAVTAGDSITPETPEQAPQENERPTGPTPTTPEAPEAPAQTPAQPAELDNGEPAKTVAAQLVLFPGLSVDGELARTMRVKESDSGARSLTMLPRTGKGFSLKKYTGKKGKALIEYERQMADKAKVETGGLISRVIGSREWTFKRAAINATGSILSVSFRRVEPLTASAPRLTEADAKRKLGLPADITMEELQAVLEMVREMKAQPEAAQG